MNVADLLSRSAAAHGPRTAVELGDRSLTYTELDTLAGRVAALLIMRGVAPSDRVALMMPNLLEFPALYYGILVPLIALLTLLPISLNGMGLREGGTVLLLAPLGVGTGEALTLSLLTFAVTLAAGALGGLALLFGGNSTAALPASEGAEPEQEWAKAG